MPRSVVVGGARTPIGRGMGASTDASTDAYSAAKHLTRAERFAPGVRRRRHGDRRERLATVRRRRGGGCDEPGQCRTAGLGGAGRDRRPRHVAGPDASLLSQPANAITKAPGREGLSPADVDLFEMNGSGRIINISSIIGESQQISLAHFSWETT